MHKKVAAASSLLSEWALALRRTIGDQQKSASETEQNNSKTMVQRDKGNPNVVKVTGVEDEKEAVGTNHTPERQRLFSAKASTTPQTPDIHPELTLAQIQQHQKVKKRSSQDNELNDRKLEINTMFDFHSRMALKPSNKSDKPCRRSSVAVMAAHSRWTSYNQMSRFVPRW